MTNLSNPALIVFIKNPVIGKVKTRIAETAGKERAFEIYLALLKHTRNLALSINVQRYLFYSDYIDDQDFWPAKHFHKRLQEGADLGQRMSKAFEQVMALHSPAVIIGSDCASLTPEIIERTFLSLQTYPFVLGPATDGGYYLLGMKKFTPFLFTSINWSTSQVFQQTIDKLSKLQASYKLLPELSDIDYESDWEKYGWEI